MSCCSGSSFTPAPDAALDPEKRVNFTFGMVLGVDDFRQEHAYLAGRDERSLRETIGYGVLAGLHVSCEPTQPADKSKYTVRVAPGLAVLPDGKQVGVPVEQCAALTEWLSGANKKTNKETGAFPVYVVLRHAETSGTPVPIPGEPCRDESALLANSRIANSFAIDFSWVAPASAEDNALRSFAAWLRAVPVHNAPASASSLEQFQEELEKAVNEAIAAGWPAKVDPPLSQTPVPPASTLVIPHERYAEFITAAFDVWIRRLRPKVLAANPPLAPADADPALLLAAIDIKLKDGLFEEFASTRQLGRPQLAHLRLLQEWLLTRADEAPRDASYVLGKADPRLPEAQSLHAAFAGANAKRRLARVEITDGKGLLKPARIHPHADAEYYGPAMTAPIPVGDGGTGQAGDPAPGQLLVGAATAVTPRAFARGWLKGAQPDSTGKGRNVVVDVGQAPDILLDTAQDIDSTASPSFVGLSLNGNLTVDGTATIDGATTLGGTATVSGLLTASGNITTPNLTVSGLSAGLVGSDSTGLLTNALRWDGLEANLGTIQTYYYAPGQGHAVRIADGGTGLTAGPAPLQVLVGRNDNPATPSYALATLEAGSNVALALSKSGGASPTWKLTINATGGGPSLNLPLATEQGGTGQKEVPLLGQILIGDGNKNFALGALAVGDRGNGPNLTLDTTAAALTLDTVQDLHTKATPTFHALRLMRPSAARPTHGLGWNNESRHVVSMPLPISRNLTLVDAPDKFPAKVEEWEKFLAAGDQVLVHAIDQAVKVDSLPPPAIDGQMLIFKVYRSGGRVSIEDNGSIDVGAIGIAPGQSLTLVGCVTLKQWLLVGRS